MEFTIKLTQRFANRKFEYLVFVCGAIVGIWFVSPHNFLPWNIDWLTLGNDGSAFHISWEFFRQSPMLQWPITATPKYLEGANTVLTSANGIFGIPAKALGLIFRGQFQFYGVWVAMTFALQALLGFRLIGVFISDRISQIIGSSLFYSPLRLFFVLVICRISNSAPIGSFLLAYIFAFQTRNLF